MAAAIVQETISALQPSATTSVNLSFSSPVSSGNLIVVRVGFRIGSTSPITVTVSDNAGNSYAQAVAPGTGTFVYTTTIVYAKNVTGGSITVTVALSAAVTNNWSAAITEVSGCDTAAPRDKTAKSDNGFSNSASTGSTGTLTQANEIALSCLLLGSVVTPTEGGGFTRGASNTQAFTGYDVVAATTALNATWSLSGSTSWAASVATFIAAAGGGGTPVALSGLIAGSERWSAQITRPGGSASLSGVIAGHETWAAPLTVQGGSVHLFGVVAGKETWNAPLSILGGTVSITGAINGQQKWNATLSVPGGTLHLNGVVAGRQTWGPTLLVQGGSVSLNAVLSGHETWNAVLSNGAPIALTGQIAGHMALTGLLVSAPPLPEHLGTTFVRLLTNGAVSIKITQGYRTGAKVLNVD